jgi:vacuolar-type H+-ATPase subunit I/STV1
MSNNLRDYVEFKELEKVVTQVCRSIQQLKSELHELKQKQHKEAVSLQKQINRRPVDMTQMRDELFDDVSKQVEWRLSQKVSEFDGVVNNFFANARFTPDAKVSEQFDTNVKVDKEDK